MMEKKIDITDWENWCFICKDGGRLLLCDHEGCSKVYHPKCVGKDRSIFKSKKSWTCSKHVCSECLSHSVPVSYSCLCCPHALCISCYLATANNASEFSLMRGKDTEGLCRKCLELVRLAEANSKFGPDGKRLNVKNRGTFECRFKECWEIIKESELVCLADVYVHKSPIWRKRKAEAECTNDNKGDDHLHFHKSPILRKRERKTEAECTNDNNGDDHLQFQEPIFQKRQKVEEDFIGWGSKPLVKFLESIGKHTTKQLPKRELGAAIYEYAIDRHLFEYKYFKTQLRSDYRLNSIFKMNGEYIDVVDIYSYLDPHLNNAEETYYASLVASNMKLVYLRRSLVEKLMLEQPEKWERKVVGSFVKFDRKLIQVKGITTTKEDNNADKLLVLFGREDPVSISLLSDEELTQEDLQRSAELCLLRKPTMMEIKEKASEVHEDITKDWIERELVRLKNNIADEMKQQGWISRDLSEYRDQMEKLQKPSEQERLLKQVPLVIQEKTKICLFF